MMNSFGWDGELSVEDLLLETDEYLKQDGFEPFDIKFGSYDD